MASAQNTVCFSIGPNPNPNDTALAAFTKYVRVLDCFEIYAEAIISDAKVLHAAAVAAELLDNDEDGQVDDALLKTQLANSTALMPIFLSEGSPAENAFFNYYNGNGVAAVLYNNEIDPSQPGHWGADASVEEILHTINYVGHSNIYPSAFDILPNSSLLTAAMDVARGGQFLTPPWNNYPPSAWYHYNDNTCDYGCMAVEYIYWAIVTNMGILDDPQTAAGIADEWEPYSPALLQSTDTLVYQLITDPQYKIPQLAPDGNYCPTSTSLPHPSESLDQAILFPNPAQDMLSVRLPSQITSVSLRVWDLAGREVLSQDFAGVKIAQVDISELPGNAYVLSLSSGDQSAYFKFLK